MSLAPSLRFAGPFIASAGQTVFTAPWPRLGLAVTVWSTPPGGARAPVTGAAFADVPGGLQVTLAPRLAGERIEIEGTGAIERQQSYSAGSALNADDLNRDMNRLTALLQEQARDQAGLVASAVRVPAGETAIVLPASEGRAGKALWFDDGGNPIAIDGKGPKGDRGFTGPQGLPGNGRAAVSALLGAIVGQRVGGALILQKTRSSGAVSEHAILAQCGRASTDWVRWLMSNHGNQTSGAGQLRATLATLATTVAETITPVPALNIYTSDLSPNTQDVAAGAVIRARAAGTNTGTFIDQTIYGMQVARTQTAGDYVEHTISGVETVLVRGMGFTNSGKIAVTATVSGSPVAADLWIVPLTGSDRIIDFKVAQDRIHQIPIIRGLNPSLTYTIRCTLLADGANDVRMHLAGLVGWPVANTTAGVRGFFDLQPNPPYPLLWTAGERWITAHTDTTQIDQIMRCATDGAVARFEIYNATGVLVRSGTLDTWAADTVVRRFTLAKGLPRGTYYAHLIHNGTAHASATLPAKLYCGGRPAMDTWAPTRDWQTNPPDVGDAPAQGTSTPTGTNSFFGFDATMERVVDAWAADAPWAGGDYLGGVHGQEVIVGAPVFRVDGQVVDFAGAALNTRWEGADAITVTYTTRLIARNTGAAIIECQHTQTVTAAGYLSSIIHTVLVPTRIAECYAAMPQVPNRAAGSTGLGGGFSRWVATGIGEIPFGPPATVQEYVEPPSAVMAANDQWAVIAVPRGLAALRDFFASKGASLTNGRGWFVWRREDGRDKAYWRGFNSAPARPGQLPNEPASVLLSPGDTFTTGGFYAAARALNAADVA